MTDIRVDLDAAIKQVVSQHEAAIVTKWIAIIETVDASNRGFYALTADGMMPWDCEGMLSYGRDGILSEYEGDDE